MAEPKYPTKEGIWSKGLRSEEKYKDVKLGLPFKKAVESFRGAVQSRDDFDPAVIFVWGTMQAMAVLYILKDVEKAFGAEGQEVVRKAINKSGWRAAKEMMANSDFPNNLSDAELGSFITTGINTVLYASLEKPWIENDKRYDFDILWCPHQDMYTAFDCRVQRYFVEGMLDAMEDSGIPRVLPIVDMIIPHGDDHCHFFIQLMEDDEGRNPWHDYSDDLAQKALERVDVKFEKK